MESRVKKFIVSALSDLPAGGTPELIKVDVI